MAGVLVTEKRGRLKVYTAGGSTATITGAPTVSYGGQGGLADVVLHPGFAANNFVYLSFAEAGANSTRGTPVARARLTWSPQGGGSLSNVQVIWRQVPNVTGGNHSAAVSRSAPMDACGSPPASAISSNRFYDANLFPQWRGNAFIGGLSARALIRVQISGTTAREVQRLNLNQRSAKSSKGRTERSGCLKISREAPADGC